MRKLYSIIILSVFLFLMSNCGGDDETKSGNPVEYKQKMREFVIGISKYTKGIKSNFLIIPQNGPEILTTDGEIESAIEMDYVKAIDGVGREDLYYGFENDNQKTPSSENAYMLKYLDLFEKNDVEVLTTDYTWDHSQMDDSYNKNVSRGYISFAAPDRELNVIPDYPATPYLENNNSITSLSQAKNFLYLINMEKYGTKQVFIDALSKTNYDVLIIDMFFEGQEYSAADLVKLKTKSNGGQRLVIAYMSIGEAEDYRYYWQMGWKQGNPDWVKEENPDWKGNFKVKYWEKDWQDIIYGNDSSYSKKAINAGFDGVYLDIIDAFEYFE